MHFHENTNLVIFSTISTTPPPPLGLRMLAATKVAEDYDKMALIVSWVLQAGRLLL